MAKLNNINTNMVKENDELYVIEGQMCLVESKIDEANDYVVENISNYFPEVKIGTPVVNVVFSDRLSLAYRKLNWLERRQLKKLYNYDRKLAPDFSSVNNISLTNPYSFNWDAHGFNDKVKKDLKDRNIFYRYCYGGDPEKAAFPWGVLPLSLVKDAKENDIIQFRIDNVIFSIKCVQLKSSQWTSGKFEEALDRMVKKYN